MLKIKLNGGGRGREGFHSELLVSEVGPSVEVVGRHWAHGVVCTC